MNSKLAKRLRSIALGLTVAADDHKRKEGQSLTTKIAYKVDRHGSVIVAPNSWKGAYKALKRAAKTGKLPVNGYFPQVQSRDATPSSIVGLNIVPNGSIFMQAPLKN